MTLMSKSTCMNSWSGGRKAPTKRLFKENAPFVLLISWGRLLEHAFLERFCLDQFSVVQSKFYIQRFSNTSFGPTLLRSDLFWGGGGLLLEQTFGWHFAASPVGDVIYHWGKGIFIVPTVKCVTIAFWTCQNLPLVVVVIDYDQRRRSDLCLPNHWWSWLLLTALCLHVVDVLVIDVAMLSVNLVDVASWKLMTKLVDVVGRSFQHLQSACWPLLWLLCLHNLRLWLLVAANVVKSWPHPSTQKRAAKLRTLHPCIL